MTRMHGARPNAARVATVIADYVAFYATRTRRFGVELSDLPVHMGILCRIGLCCCTTMVVANFKPNGRSS